MIGDVKLPTTLADHMAELTRLDKEVIGAVIVNKREYDPDRDEGIAAYINLEVGEPGEVEASKEADEILNEFSERGNTRHRYFHTHPLGSYQVEGANLSGISPADEESWRENKEYHDDEHWWHLIAYNSDIPGKKMGTQLIQSSDWDIEYVEDWSFQGESWDDIGAEAYGELMDMGLEEVDPYEQARKVA